MRSVELICSFLPGVCGKTREIAIDPKEVRGNVLKDLLQPENLNNNTYSVSCKSKLHVP